MNISLNCNISLSKKLRAALGKEGTITLTSMTLKDGKGLGRLSLMSDDNTNPEIDTTETSIMITPIEVVDEVPLSSNAQASIFSSIAPKGKEDPITRLAAVHAPNKGEESRAISKPKTPKVFKQVDIPECKEWIDNMTDLINAAISTKVKDSNIDPSKARNERERAFLMEMKDREDAINIPVWIVTDNAGSLTVNDLNISMKMGVPFNLGSVSARKIVASRDLKSLISAGYIKFITPKEKDEYLSREIAKVESIGGLEVYDSPYEAERSLATRSTVDEDTGEGEVVDRNANNIRQQNRMELTEEDLEKPTEDETMLINLTQNLPTQKVFKTQIVQENNQNSRHTLHGNASNSQVVQPDRPKPTIKPIRKLE